MDIVEDLKLNHEYCPKEVIIKAADEIERLRKERDELLAAAEADMQRIGEMGPTKPRVKVFVMLQDAIASVKGGV